MARKISPRLALAKADWEATFGAGTFDRAPQWERRNYAASMGRTIARLRRLGFVVVPRKVVRVKRRRASK